MPKKLLTGEHHLLVFFILNAHLRKEILESARRDGKTSGPLLQAYEWALEL